MTALCIAAIVLGSLAMAAMTAWTVLMWGGPQR